MAKRTKSGVEQRVYELPESSPWDSGFSLFKRRIGEQLQLNGFPDGIVDGESETYVLSALGCSVYA